MCSGGAALCQITFDHLLYYVFTQYDPFIYGPEDRPGESDKEHVEKLCETELKMKANINTCKRLCKFMPGNTPYSHRDMVWISNDKLGQNYLADV